MIALKNTVLPLLGLVLALFFHPVVGVRLDACGEYACGSATWTWDTAYVIPCVLLVRTSLLLAVFLARK